MKPLDNYLLVHVGPKFTTTAVEGKPVLLLPKGSDGWAALTEDLKAGRGAGIEADSPIEQTPVCQGTVLAVPEHLTADMTLCAGPWTKYVERMKVVHDEKGRVVKAANGRAVMVGDGHAEAPVMRTCADITERVQVGDRIHFDPTCLTDEAEVAEGTYLVPYANVICTITHDEFWAFHKTRPRPIGGYLLLYRVWADDVETADVEGRPTKVRYGAGGLIAELDVPPLPNEGVIAWQGSPLRGTTDKLSIGDHVVFHGYKPFADKSQPLDTGQARVENIAGTEYLAVRQDYVLAVRPPKYTEVYDKSTGITARMKNAGDPRRAAYYLMGRDPI